MPNRYKAIVDNPQGVKDVILIVCPPSHDQQGAKFAATMETIRAQFNLQAIWLADSLDRHNSGSVLKATQRGDDWLQRHGGLIQGIPVHRWAEVRKHPDFEMKYAEINRLYVSSLEARKAVDEICARQANIIAARVISKGQTPDITDLQRRCVSYMLEEIAGLSIIRSHTDAPEIYPGDHFASPEVFHGLARIPLKIPPVMKLTFSSKIQQKTLRIPT
ncbi:MAG: hypothetical protein JWO78_178 [Micavibrio sp.]|nr:hypothetical protein [Micavibrio sp.]